MDDALGPAENPPYVLEPWRETGGKGAAAQALGQPAGEPVRRKWSWWHSKPLRGTSSRQLLQYPAVTALRVLKRGDVLTAQGSFNSLGLRGGLSEGGTEYLKSLR